MPRTVRRMRHHDLNVELREAAEAAKPSLQQLRSLGVSWRTMGGLCRNNYGFGIVRAREDVDGLYCRDSEAPPHLVLPVYEEGELVDLCAFRSSDPTRWLLRNRQGWALGLQYGLAPHCWGDPVTLSATPLEWLQGGAEGLCVVDWDAPELHHLTEVPHLVCLSDALAKRLRAALAKPVRFPTISVLETRLAA